MIDFIRAHQLNIMLLLCGACGIMVFLLIFTRFLSKSRKIILILMETVAFFLLWFDRMAYIYAGDPGHTGYIMVRVSNFMVFFLTSGIVFCFNLYLIDLLTSAEKLSSAPKGLTVAGALSAMGMVMAVVAAFTDLYYYFDESNLYHRGSGFLIAYIIPVAAPLLQYAVVRNYRKYLSRLIYISILLYIFVPILCGILQIFTYGISIVNMSMVAVSVSLYVFMYLDLNDTVEHAHNIEISTMMGEKEQMRKLFDQTATAFVSAVEKKDDFAKGNAVRIAEYAKRVAELSGKDAEECEKIYYAAMLHDVGLIGIPDSVIKNEDDPSKWDSEMMRQKPVIGNEILSSISEYPFLCEAAHYSHERYNGTGYPEGLKGEEIPEIARIIAVADAYVTMTSKKRYRDARPDFMVREAFVKGSGESFDPAFAEIMLKIMDEDADKDAGKEADAIETELSCTEYRNRISNGIPVEGNITRITFDCTPMEDQEFSAPAVILYDSYDRRVHDDEKSINAYKYTEYGELWFDEHSVTTEAKKIEESVKKKEAEAGIGEGSRKYEIVMGRYENHIKLRMISPFFEKEAIIALPNRTQSSYLALTGEYCSLTDIVVENTEQTVGPEDIPKLVDEVSYIDRMESDIKNIQIDRPRSAATQGIEIKDRLKLRFHTMSLPSASLVWHCPCILLFYSDDGQVNGEGYREYAAVKLYGENDENNEYAENSISVKRTEDFSGWDAWKEINKKGLECEVVIRKKGNRVILKTQNLGIDMENITTIAEDPGKVYAALTGDQVAITDIRITSK